MLAQVVPTAGKQKIALTPDEVTGVVGGVTKAGWRQIGSIPTYSTETAIYFRGVILGLLLTSESTGIP